jgi:hypothetical protein
LRQAVAMAASFLASSRAPVHSLVTEGTEEVFRETALPEAKSISENPLRPLPPDRPQSGRRWLPAIPVRQFAAWQSMDRLPLPKGYSCQQGTWERS